MIVSRILPLYFYKPAWLFFFFFYHLRRNKSRQTEQNLRIKLSAHTLTWPASCCYTVQPQGRRHRAARQLPVRTKDHRSTVSLLRVPVGSSDDYKHLYGVFYSSTWNNCIPQHASFSLFSMIRHQVCCFGRSVTFDWWRDWTVKKKKKKNLENTAPSHNLKCLPTSDDLNTQIHVWLQTPSLSALYGFFFFFNISGSVRHRFIQSSK